MRNGREGITGELLYDTNKLGVCAGKVQLLREAVSKWALKTFTESGDLCDFGPILSFCFVKNTLELRDIGSEGFIGRLLDRKETVLCFLNLIRVVVHTAKGVENCIIVVNTGITLGGELRKNHSLNLASEIEVDVVELSYRISYGGSVDSELGTDRGIPRIVFHYETGELLGIGEGGFWSFRRRRGRRRRRLYGRWSLYGESLLERELKALNFITKVVDSRWEFCTKLYTKLLNLIHFDEDQGRKQGEKNCTSTLCLGSGEMKKNPGRKSGGGVCKSRRVQTVSRAQLTECPGAA
jgi:hypothetical protein